MQSMRSIRQTATVSAALLLILFFAPAATIRREAGASAEKDGRGGYAETEARTGAEEEGADARRIVRVLRDGAVETMTMRDYLFGVLAAEMPASFEIEALKAQCVAARTYTLYKIERGGSHGEAADVCTDAGCCQAFTDAPSARAKWGASAEAYEEKLRAAVEETDGEAILYGGAPILAAFHSSTSGVTRGAGEVWQDDLPYLRPVSSPETGAEIPNYFSRVEVPADEFRQKIASAVPLAQLSGAPEEWLGALVTDGGGNVITASVGGASVRGSRVRAIFSLRSACFTWRYEAGNVAFFVTGHGHGVGMSQYGAQEMAKQGADYRAILTHYYTGVSVEPFPAR